jgi:hypothetical protein
VPTDDAPMTCQILAVLTLVSFKPLESCAEAAILIVSSQDSYIFLLKLFFSSLITKSDVASASIDAEINRISLLLTLLWQNVYFHKTYLFKNFKVMVAVKIQ